MNTSKRGPKVSQEMLRAREAMMTDFNLTAYRAAQLYHLTRGAITRSQWYKDVYTPSKNGLISTERQAAAPRLELPHPEQHVNRV